MSAHKSFFQTSDFIVYTSVLVALVLEFIFPTTLYLNSNILIVIGIFLILLAWTIIFIVKRQFKKYNQKSGPDNEIHAIITGGLFEYSRNPIYVGVIILMSGVGFILNSVWIFIVAILSFLLIRHYLVLPEEKYLTNKFGEQYTEYVKKVRRWL